MKSELTNSDIAFAVDDILCVVMLSEVDRTSAVDSVDEVKDNS